MSKNELNKAENKRDNKDRWWVDMRQKINETHSKNTTDEFN